MTVVKHFFGEGINQVPMQSPAVPLPSSFVLDPGVYLYNGVQYDCSDQGFYRFWHPMDDTQNRIVWAGDVEALMSGLSWLSVNGRADETLSLAAKTNTARTSKLRMLCGKTCEWVKYICDSANIAIPTRIVRTLTAGAPNNYYDGHVMIEAQIDGQWHVYDIANNQSYEASDGLRAAKDIFPLDASVTRHRLARDGYAIEPFTSGTFDVTAWQENTMLDEDSFNSEVERVLQIPGIDDPDGNTYFYLPAGMEGSASYVTGLSSTFRLLPEAEWMTRFYP